MRGAKTAGGIKNSTSNAATYEKWALSRPLAAECANALHEHVGLDKTSNYPRKCLRDSEIRKSEKRVERLQNLITNDLINPFSDDLDKDKLYNLASGCPVDDEIANCQFKKREQRCFKILDHV